MKRASLCTGTILAAAVAVLGLAGLLVTASKTSMGGEAVRESDAPVPPGALMRIGTLRLRHADFVMAVAFSPDGNTLASGDHLGELHLWDVATGKRAKKLEGRHTRLSSLVFSPDGEWLYTGGGPGADSITIRVWDVDTGEVFSKSASNDSVNCLALSPDGKLLASGGEVVFGGGVGSVMLWETPRCRNLLGIQRHERSIQSLAFSPDGNVLAAGARDGEVLLWDVESGLQTWNVKARRRDVNCIAFSPDGKTLASGGRLQLWDVDTAEKRLELQANEKESGATAVAFSPDGKLLAASDGYETLRLWDPSTGRLLRKLQGDWQLSGSSHSLAFSPDGKTLAAAGRVNTVYLWDVQSGQELLRFSQFHEGSIRQVAYSPDGKAIASAAWDGTIRLWDGVTGKNMFSLKAETVAAICFSPDSKVLAAGGFAKSIDLYDVVTGEEVGTFPTEEMAVVKLAFSPDGKLLAAAFRSRDMIGMPGWSEENPIKVWDVASGKAAMTAGVGCVPQLPASIGARDHSSVFGARFSS